MPKWFVVLLLLLLVALSEAWTKTQMALMRPPCRFLRMTPDEHATSFDKVQVTTKTNKQLVYDDKTGRFFETSTDPKSSSVTTTDSILEDPTDVSQLDRTVAGTGTGMPFFNKNEREVKRTEAGTSPPTSAATKEADRFPHIEVVSDILVSDYAARNPQPPSIKRIESIVEQAYAAWNQRDMLAVAECFDERLEYQDSQYLGIINSKPELIRHFDNQAKLLPPSSQLVLKNIAIDPSNGNIGTQWYLQAVGTDGVVSKVPYTKGCSFYMTNPDNCLIVSGFRASEMIFKPTKQSVNLLLSSLPPLIQRRTQSRSRSKSRVPRSIVDEYFDAWNRRDVSSTVECFVEDCAYQVEGPIFVNTLRGREALRAHLDGGAASLPPGCQIILDCTAVDATNGNIAALWHLEVNGIVIPNLRGCSMYTTDSSTGLLKSGFEVTETPVKVPRQLLSSTSLLSLPARVLFGQ